MERVLAQVDAYFTNFVGLPLTPRSPKCLALTPLYHSSGGAVRLELTDDDSEAWVVT
jgi:hypothetical protein